MCTPDQHSVVHVLRGVSNYRGIQGFLSRFVGSVENRRGFCLSLEQDERRSGILVDCDGVDTVSLGQAEPTLTEIKESDDGDVDRWVSPQWEHNPVTRARQMDIA